MNKNYLENLRGKLENLQLAFPGKIHDLKNKQAEIDMIIFLLEKGNSDKDRLEDIVKKIEQFCVDLVGGKR